MIEETNYRQRVFKKFFRSQIEGSGRNGRFPPSNRLKFSSVAKAFPEVTSIHFPHEFN